MTMWLTLAALAATAHSPQAEPPRDPLLAGFQNPPATAKLRAYWWWLNGNVTKESIRHDLEEMAAKGFGGAVIIDANGAEQWGNAPVPHGPTFFSPAWRELYKYAVQIAAKQGLELSLNIQSGWNLGGPNIGPEDAPKKLVWASAILEPVTYERTMVTPMHMGPTYHDVAVVAYPVSPQYDPQKQPTIDHWKEKALLSPLPFSAPDTSLLLTEHPARPGEQTIHASQIIDITSKMRPDGILDWNPPSGRWEVLRFGYSVNDQCFVSTSSEGWKGYALDPFNKKAFLSYWNQIVEPLLADAGPEAGKTLKYLHTDSWEIEVANWTPGYQEAFRRLRGYDMTQYWPTIAGRIVDNRNVTDRFLNDFRRTFGDLAIENHYQPFRDLAHKHNLLIHPESGGPHAVPIDSLQCLGFDDAPMSEFWASSWMHRVKDEDRFFVKQPSSAAHTYGHTYSVAEAFTTIGPHWQESLWSNLKPNFDEACCQGMNRVVWHAFVCSPEETGLPGQQYFAGTHLNPKVTWWPVSKPFFSYLNRCQFMLQQGRFVADVLSYYGNHVPNFSQLKSSDPAHCLPGYDYDVATEEVLLKRVRVKGGRLCLPDGMSYRVLTLPERTTISLPVLRKLKSFVAAGATVLGPKPTEATSLSGFPKSDDEVHAIADELWGTGTTAVGSHRYGKGQVIWGQTSREVLAHNGVAPDLEFENATDGLRLNSIHRESGGKDIYFVANRAPIDGSVDATFRVSGKTPVLWNPINGERLAVSYTKLPGGRVDVHLNFTPCGSWFVVFTKQPAPAQSIVTLEPKTVLDGPWQVSFDPKWAGPANVQFDQLVDWTKRPEDGIRHYSGVAVYRRSFDAPDGQGLVLDLGDVKEIAEVIVNGKNLGIVWAPPFRVPLDIPLKPSGNQLEVRITNTWANRVIGDQALPEAKRLTRTNIKTLKADAPLMESGLLGPVRILAVRPR